MIWMVLLVTFVAIIAYEYFIKPFMYWKKKGVYQDDMMEQYNLLYKAVSQKQPAPERTSERNINHENHRYVGIYHFLRPALLIRDPDLIKQLAVKDFDHFVDRRSIFKQGIEPLWDKNLIGLKGDMWREMRATLSPSFTSSKIKAMFDLVSECCSQLVDHIETVTKTETTEVDLKDIFVRYSINIIASIAFGISCDSLKNRSEQFYLMGEQAAHLEGKHLAMILALPNVAKMMGVKLYSDEMQRFFRELVKQNMEHREREGIVRADMINLLMEAKKNKLMSEKQQNGNGVVADMNGNYKGLVENEKPQIKNGIKHKNSELSDEDLAAQAFVFFLAGFDTVAATMTFMSYELALHPDIQQRLLQEVDETLSECNGKLTYDVVTKMKYMDMVISETLRKWPPIMELTRTCVKPYTIPAERPWEKPVALDVGDIIAFRVDETHRDPHLYPDPEAFDPERFNEFNRPNIHPYAYIPFGAGPRNCIGNRFAMLELKLTFVHFLSRYEVSMTEKTRLPLKCGRSRITLCLGDDLYLNLKPRK